MAYLAMKLRVCRAQGLRLDVLKFYSRRTPPIRRSSSRMQRSVVKVSYSPNKRLGQWKAHGKYLQREGAQQEEHGLGFDAHGAVDIVESLDRWQKAGDARLFRVIVSPEAGDRLDLHTHVHRLMERVENDLGTPLQWVAIDHRNTEHPHAHIVIRGVDGCGKPLKIERDYIRQGFRQRSQEVATRQIGHRQARDMLLAREKVTQQKHITPIDREILRKAGSAGKLSFHGGTPGSEFEFQWRMQTIRRLRFLESLGLAERSSALSWKISSELDSRLREYQVANDIVKRQRHTRRTPERP